MKPKQRLFSAGFLALALAVVGVGASASTGVGGKVGSGDVSPDGREYVVCGLADGLQEKNRVGTDGAGLCVFASLTHAGRWQDDKLFASMLDFMERYPGGGYPRKVDLMLKKCSQETGAPVPDYIQVEDNDLEILKLAIKSRYMPCVTYSSSPTGRYGGQRIYHMVNVVHASDQWWCVLDNNYPGTRNFEWLTEAEFRRAYTGTGTGWCVILMTLPTPPQPHN